MAGYAKIQRWCFIGGLVGFAVIVILLLINSHADFVAAFNREGAEPLRRQQRLRGHQRGGRQGRLHHIAASASARSGRRCCSIPALMFFLLWPNWGTTLYGEIRGASDFKRVFTGMFFGLWLTVAFTVIFLLLMAKTFGWGFYQNLNSLDYNAAPRSSASGRTRSCSRAGWCTTPPSR